MFLLKRVIGAAGFLFDVVMKPSFGKKGFTLIELIVVVIIVAILATIAGPMMTGNVTKAKKSEAVAALGAIRTAERLYYTEFQTYVNVSNFANTTNPLVSYLATTDLAGRYYNGVNYNVTGSSASAFTATAVNSTLGTNITINQDGTITGN